MSDALRGVDLAECCRRLGISRRAGERLLADGRFPIPELPNLGLRLHRYSTYEIELYLREASVRDERERARVRLAR